MPAESPPSPPDFRSSLHELVRGHSPKDEEALDRLIRGFDSGTVIPVIGAGVSHQSAGLPLWSEVLGYALDWCHENTQNLHVTADGIEELRERLDLRRPTPEAFETWARAAFCASQDQEPSQHPLYGEWLQQTFGKPYRVTDDRIYEVLRAIEPRLVITTNYDHLLTEWAFRGRKIVTWDHGPDAIRRLFREEQGVFHLHGAYDHARSVVLTSRDYQRVLDLDTESNVAGLMSSHGILLFIGISPAGATDAHLSQLLKLGRERPADAPPPNEPAHVLLHSGDLEPRDSYRLRQYDIYPVSYGETHELGDFLHDLTRARRERQDAVSMLDLKQRRARVLKGSTWDPTACVERVERDVRFMGWRSSKWVSAESLGGFSQLLRALDHVPDGQVKFLIVNPTTDAFERLLLIRPGHADRSHLDVLLGLQREHKSFEVRCLSYLPAFRVTAIDEQELGFALYPRSRIDNANTDAGWFAPHFTVETHRPWTIGRSLLFMFDELYMDATRLDEVLEG